MSTKYNGWTNYETWCVNLWLDNEEPLQRYWAAIAALWLNQEPNARLAAYELARQLAEEVIDWKPEVTGMWADLLGAALSEVNWNEIAGYMIGSCEPQR
jgi:hypothetical protein